MKYHLAPLKSRRDMAMLGVIHRSVLREGPEQVWSHFPFAPVSSHPCGRNNLRRHDKQLQSHRQENRLEMTAHSILGLADIYNLLPQRIVNNTCVHKFQRELQDLMKETATDRNLDWECMYSPRIPLHLHPLRRFFGSPGMGNDGSREP